jgi:hypothetical protein
MHSWFFSVGKIQEHCLCEKWTIGTSQNHAEMYCDKKVNLVLQQGY